MEILRKVVIDGVEHEFPSTNEELIREIVEEEIAATKDYVDVKVVNKVDKVAGMGLSENDFTDIHKAMLEMVNPKKNLIGTEAKVLYPVLLPKGTTLTMSTSDGSTLVASNSLWLYYYDIEGKAYDFWTFNSSSTPNNKRTITLDQDTYYLSWNKEWAVSIQVELGTQATEYEPYKGWHFATSNEKETNDFTDIHKAMLEMVNPKKNLIGTDATVLYPVLLPKGTTLTMSTSDGSTLVASDGIRLLCYGIDKAQNEAWGFNPANSKPENKRTVTLETDTYFVSWSKEWDVPIQVEIGTQATEYEEYKGCHFSVADGSGSATNTLTDEQEAATQRFASLFSNTTGLVESFLFFTDPHLVTSTGLNATFDTRLDTVKAIYDTTPVSMCVSGGDWLNNGNSRDNACWVLGKIDGGLKSRFDKYINVIGNHDTNYQGKEYCESGYDRNKIAECILSQETIRNLWYRKQGNAYFAVDGDTTKFYVFDTGIDFEAAMSAYRWEQIDWFANSLKTDDPERCAAFLHIGMETSATPFIENLTKIAQAFNNKSTATLNGVLYDFTGTSGRFHFILSGHTHSDENFMQNSIPVVATTNLCVSNDVTLDLVLADYATNKLHLVRIGSGSDREIDMA